MKLAYVSKDGFILFVKQNLQYLKPKNCKEEITKLNNEGEQFWLHLGKEHFVLFFLRNYYSKNECGS